MKLIYAIFSCLAASLVIGPAAQSAELPKVLILGDSISMGYTKAVQTLMKGKADVRRPRENCAGTTKGLLKIDQWIGDTKWDVIHFNWGLHDLKHVQPDTGKNSTNPKHPQQADIITYGKNLEVLVKKLKATNAKLIFATTTPYPDKPGGPLRRANQPAKYNAVALKIMERYNVGINDLYGYALPLMKRIQRPNNVHFTQDGSRALAQQVVASIEAALK